MIKCIKYVIFYEGSNFLLSCQIFWPFWPENVKGSLTRDFELQVFFIHQCPLGPFWPFQIFLKICGNISESILISSVNYTSDKRKMLRYKFIHILLRAYLNALYSCRLNFCLFFIFRSRQAVIVGTVLSAVSLTPAKNLSTVSLAPVNSFFFGGVVDTSNKF